MKLKKTLGIVGVAAVALIGGSFAYFNQTMSVENPFDTGKYDTVLTEDFKPEDGQNWEPGAEVNKDIEVKNTGDYDVLVRVKFDEKWVNKDSGVTIVSHTGMDTTTGQDNDADGLVAKDDSVVKKTLNADNWVYNEADGYWYYKANIEPGATTGTFLDAVTLLENTDMGKYKVINYYTEAETKPAEDATGDDPKTQWVKYDTEKGMPKTATHTMAVTVQEEAGYSNADYTLTITAQTVQATDAAMKSAFGLKAAPTGCNWTLGAAD